MKPKETLFYSGQKLGGPQHAYKQSPVARFLIWQKPLTCGKIWNEPVGSGFDFENPKVFPNQLFVKYLP